MICNTYVTMNRRREFAIGPDSPRAHIHQPFHRRQHLQPQLFANKLLQHCATRNTLISTICNSTDYQLPVGDRVFKTDGSQGASRIHHHHTSPRMQMRNVVPASSWMRTWSINHRRVGRGRAGAAGVDSVIMQLSGRYVRLFYSLLSLRKVRRAFVGRGCAGTD